MVDSWLASAFLLRLRTIVQGRVRQVLRETAPFLRRLYHKSVFHSTYFFLLIRGLPTLPLKLLISPWLDTHPTSLNPYVHAWTRYHLLVVDLVPSFHAVSIHLLSAL